MPTKQEEKPGKPRSRSRKADQRNAKAEAKAQAVRDQVSIAAPISPMVPAVEEAAAEIAPVTAPSSEETVAEIAPAEVGPAEVAPAEVAMEKSVEAALSGEVLPPEVRHDVPQMAPASAIATAYGDYTRKSWQANRRLMERLIAVRSFDEAVEIQGEFARQAYANFLAESERICVLYGEWARQSFRPYEKLATEWIRAGR